MDLGHAPGLPKLEKAARLSSEDQNSKVSPTEARWEQGCCLLTLCGRICLLALEAACTSQLVLHVLNDWSFLLPSLHLPPSPSPSLLLQGSGWSVALSSRLAVAWSRLTAASASWVQFSEKWNNLIADLHKQVEELSERKYGMSKLESPVILCS